MRRYRPRKQFKFWLYHDLLEDLRLMEYIAYLRKTQQFAKVLRSGLRLMWTLGEGDLSILFELYPTLRSQFVPGGENLIQEFRRLLEEHQIAIPDMPKLEPLSKGSAKPLLAPEIPMPTFDDEDTMVVRRDVNAGANTTANFLDAAFGFQKREDD